MILYIVALIAMIMCSCANINPVSDGVIGPISYWNADRVKRNNTRNYLNAAVMAQQERESCIRIMDHNGVPAVAIDVFRASALLSEPSTQVPAVVADIGFWALMVELAKQYAEKNLGSGHDDTATRQSEPNTYQYNINVDNGSQLYIDNTLNKTTNP